MTTEYDLIEYNGGAFTQTHPANLAAIARLHGVDAAPPTKCRVLEIGTADGANLFPMALSYPHSEFVGIDLAETPIRKGNETIKALGLKNLKLAAVDLCTLPEDWGQFDYILAHGVFSWVPVPVQEALLALCQKFLTPNGIAYISYNAMPGGHIPQMISEILKFHTRKIPAPEEKISQSRRLMKLLFDGTNVPGALGEIYKAEAKKVMQDYSDAVIYHDDLAEPNRRLFIHEFAEMADKNDLQFLAEADYHEMTNAGFPQNVANLLDELASHDRIQSEQYRDFLCLRRFRQTLLTRRDVTVTVKADLNVVRQLHVIAKPLKCETNTPNWQPGVKVEFSTVKGSLVTLDHPLGKAVLWELSQRPFEALSIDQAIALGQQHLGTTSQTEGSMNAVLSTLYQCFMVGMVTLQFEPAPFTLTPGVRPKVCPLVRYQIIDNNDMVTTRRHSTIRLDTHLTRQLLLACDGTRERPAIVDKVVAWAIEQPQPQGQPPETAEQIRTRLTLELDDGLRQAAGLGLFVE